MKKRKRKGFTLVELLAVIIILAIVIGITIPAILSTINDSKNKALETSVNAAQKWAEAQVTIYNTNSELVENDFMRNVAEGNMVVLTVNVDNGDEGIVALGMKTADVIEVGLVPHENGEVCVIVSSVPTSGGYYNTKYWAPQYESEEETAPTWAIPGDGTKFKVPSNRSSHCTDDDKLN